jgi:hypothetical protein
MKISKEMMTAFWYVAPCSLAEIYQCFRGAYCVNHHGDDEGSKHFSNADKFLPDYMAQHPRRQSSLYLLQ